MHRSGNKHCRGRHSRRGPSPEKPSGSLVGMGELSTGGRMNLAVHADDNGRDDALQSWQATRMESKRFLVPSNIGSSGFMQVVKTIGLEF